MQTLGLERSAGGDAKAVRIQQPHYQWPILDAALEDAIARQARRSLSDRDATGIIGEFERAFCEFTGRRYAVAFTNGTSAIQAMAVASEIPPGSEILCCAYGFFASVSPFAYEGMKLVFCDSDAFGNLTVDTLARNLTERTRAVLVTHMWGNPHDMTAISEFCRERGLLLFEDCSHSHFAAWRNRRVGTFGDMAAYSLNQKVLTGGEGGVLVTDAERYRDMALLFGHYNGRCRKEIDPSRDYYAFATTGLGLKHRPHPLAMAIALNQLEKRNDIERRRRRNMARFCEAAEETGVLRPLIVDPRDGQHGLYVMGFTTADRETRDAVHRFMHAEGATEFDVPNSTTVMNGEPLFYRWPLANRAPAPPAAPRPEEEFPVACQLRDTFLKLPLWGYEGDEEAVDQYCDAIGKLRKAR